MITTRSFFILNPTWVLVKDLSIKRIVSGTPTWRPVKQAYIKRFGVWNQVYSENVAPGSSFQQHPYWQYTLDSEFRVNDNNQNDGLATDLFYTFWSTSNAGTYAISLGTARININSIDTNFVAAVPATDPVTNFTTETNAMFCNFTSGINTAITFNGSPPLPIDRIGVDGQTYRWQMLNTGSPNPIPTGNPTRIQAVSNNNPSPGLATITMSRNAAANVNGYTANLTRTYASSITPGTPGTPAYYTHYGITRMLSNYELRVSGGQTYRISSQATSGVDSNTRWGINAYTSPNAGQAAPFGTGSQPFQSPTYGTQSSQTFDITVPSGHIHLRVGIFIEHNSSTSTNSPPAIPLFGRFEHLRVVRV